MNHKAKRIQSDDRVTQRCCSGTRCQTYYSFINWMGNRPQTIINKQILGGCDLLGLIGTSIPLSSAFELFCTNSMLFGLFHRISEKWPSCDISYY
jgi:hypothetical protein